MANNEEQVVQTADVEEEVATPEVPVEDVEITEEPPVAKTKKELKKERKEIKKQKKLVKKEAKRHSAKTTRAENFWLTVLKIFILAIMIASCVFLAKSVKSLTDGASGDSGQQSAEEVNQGGGSSSSSGSSASGSGSGAAATPAEGSSEGAGAAAVPADANADLSTPAGILSYYKAAYAKASSAKKIVKYYDNTINYNEHLEIGGNSTLAGIAKTLMGTFMKEDTTEHEFDGAEGAKTLPPDGGSVDGLTLDMLKTPTCEEKNGKYIITLQINSDENNYDTGDKTKHLTNTVDEKAVTDAAGSMVNLSGLENRYFGAKVIATIDKETGNLENLETYIPSYMCFGEAGVLVIKVKNVSIGLEYQQKWRLEY